MAEEDDEYPPEIHRGEKEFLFREVTSFNLLKEDFRSDKRRLNLMTFANIFGLTIVASKSGFKGYKTGDLLKKEAKVIFDVELQSSPCWIAVSSNNLTLVVCCTGAEQGLQALFFDMRHLVNESKTTKVAFSELDLPVNSASDFIADLHWNPSTEVNKETGAIENGKFLAICINTGAFLMLAVEETVKYHAEKPTGFGASAVCWSPRGKQAMIGKSDGSLQQYTPAMELKRSVPAWEALDRSVRVSDVLWLSSYQVALTYTIEPSTTYESPNLLIVHLPSTKEPNKNPQWQLYEDPNYGNGSVRFPRSFMNYIEKWNLFAYLTSTSAETSLLGKNKDSNKWEIWSLDDNCLARVPYGDQTDDEPFVIGTGIILTSSENVVLDERDYGKMPVLALLSCDGMLTLYHVVGRTPNQFPSITNLPTTIPITGDNRTKSPPPQHQPFAGVGLLDKSKPKLTAKPSIRVATTTPTLSGFPASSASSLNFPASSQLGFPPPSSSSPLPPASYVATLPTLTEAPQPLLPPTATPPQQPPVEHPVVARVPTTPSTVVKSFFSTQQPPPPAATALSSGTTSFQLPTALAPSSGLNVQPSAVKVVKKLADPPALTSPPVENRRKKTTTLLIPPDVLVEVDDFQRELNRFLDNSSLKKEIESLGTQKMKTDHVAAVNDLAKFKREIFATIKEQHADIEDTSTVCIEAFASLRNFEKQKDRARNSKFRETLLSRPLDSNDQKAMKEIRSLYQYVKETVRDADATLNDQWANFMNTSNTNHKSRRQVEMEERDKVHRAVVNQTKILHGQETKLTLLSQTLDRLRLQRTANWRGDSYNDIYSQYDKELRDLNRSISNIKIKSEPSEKLVGNVGVGVGRLNDSTAARKRSHEVRVMKSNRSMELNNWLSSRTRTPVRTTVKKYRNSSMLFQPQHSSPIKLMEAHSSVAAPSSTVASSSIVESTRTPSSSSDESSSEYDEILQQTIKVATAAAAPPPPSKSMIGSSTITYGAPDGGGKHQTPSSLYDATQHKEAQSNLNNPPLVVNIKELKEPQLTVPTFSPKFKPTSADVSIGAANEVQKVLNTVIAEKQSGTSLLPPTLQSSAAETSTKVPPPSYPTSSCQAVKVAMFLPQASNQGSNQGDNAASVITKVDFSSSSSSALGVGTSPTFSKQQDQLQASSSPSVARNLFGSKTTSVESSNVFGQPTSDKPPSLFGGSTSTIDFQQSNVSSSSSSFLSATSSVFSGLSTYSAATSQVTAAASSGLLGTLLSSSTSSSGGIFGTAPQATSSSSGGIFGATSAPTVSVASSEGLFGAPSASTASSGAPSALSSTTATSGSVFGAPSALGADATAATSGGIFGTPSAPAATTAATGGLFGAPSGPAATTAISGGLYGAPSTPAAITATTSAPGGLFGAPSTPAATTAATGGLFGTPSTPAATTATDGGLFGAPSTPAATTSTSGGLFGAPSTPAATTAATGGLFGAPSAPAATTATAGGLFGASSAPAATTATTGGLFGAPSTPAATTATAGGLFGAASAPAATTGCLFGAPSAPAVTTATAGGLFGAPSTPAATTATTGGLFGAPSTPAATTSATGGLFGAPSTPAATTATTGGLFGAPSTPAATTAATGGLFGAPSAPAAATATAGGLFGAPSAPAATTGGLFGAPSAPAVTTATAGGIFGAPSTPAATTATTGGLFGAPATTGDTGGLFGTATNSGGNDEMEETTSAPKSGLFGSQPAAFGAQKAEDSPFGGGGFMSGLGGGTTNQSSAANPFANSATANSGGDFKSIFGGNSVPFGGAKSAFGAQPTGTSAFGAQPTGTSTFGAQPTGTSAFGNQQSAGGGFGSSSGFGFGAKPPVVEQQNTGFGAFNKSSSGFGSAPVFGSSPLGGGAGGTGFGQKAVFGGSALSPSSFGGGSAFGSQQPNTAAPSGGFAAYANNNTGSNTGFGQLAATSPNSGGGGFGAPPNQQQPSSGGFGSLAGGGSAFGGGGGFGSNQQQQQQQQQNTPKSPSFTQWR